MTPLDAFELPLPFETQNVGPTDIQYPIDDSSTFEFTPIYLKFDMNFHLIMMNLQISMAMEIYACQHKKKIL